MINLKRVKIHKAAQLRFSNYFCFWVIFSWKIFRWQTFNFKVFYEKCLFSVLLACVLFALLLKDFFYRLSFLYFSNRRRSYKACVSKTSKSIYSFHIATDFKIICLQKNCKSLGWVLSILFRSKNYKSSLLTIINSSKMCRLFSKLSDASS